MIPYNVAARNSNTPRGSTHTRTHQCDQRACVSYLAGGASVPLLGIGIGMYGTDVEPINDVAGLERARE